jgi:hypothetical protein
MPSYAWVATDKKFYLGNLNTGKLEYFGHIQHMPELHLLHGQFGVGKYLTLEGFLGWCQDECDEDDRPDPLAVYKAYVEQEDMSRDKETRA